MALHFPSRSSTLGLAPAVLLGQRVALMPSAFGEADPGSHKHNRISGVPFLCCCVFSVQQCSLDDWFCLLEAAAGPLPAMALAVAVHGLKKSEDCSSQTRTVSLVASVLTFHWSHCVPFIG